VVARRAVLIEKRRNISREHRHGRSLNRRGKKQRKHQPPIYCIALLAPCATVL